MLSHSVGKIRNHTDGFVSKFRIKRWSLKTVSIGKDIMTTFIVSYAVQLYEQFGT